MSKTVVEIRGLKKTFMQGENEVKAVDNIDLDIQEGEFLAITGQSGSGKTTLLNLIGGIEQATAGSVLIDGANICKADNTELSRLRRKKISYVFQDFNLIPILTVEENIIMPLLLDSKKPDKERFNEIVSFLGLENRLKHLPSQLSGGQKQRVAIARALINSPEIILADEPTGNLDKTMADEIIELLIKLNKSGMTVILVTHEEKYAELCVSEGGRKIVIEDGRIVKNLKNAQKE